MARMTKEINDAYQRLHEYECPPHLIPQLLSVLAGEQELTPLLLSQMENHLPGCDYCQLAVEIVVAATIDQSAKSDSVETIENIRKQLERLKEINYSIHELDERIAAYAELLETAGEKEARKRYPDFARHLKRCLACSAKIEETRKALREAVSAGLIPPLDIPTQARG